MKDVESKFKATIDYGLFINNNIYNDSLLFNDNSKEIYGLNNFKEILISPVVLTAYQEVLDELYDVKISKEEIKTTINNIIQEHCIYFVSMNLSRFGMTLYDGTIIINKAYYGLVYSDDDAFNILFTLMHELMHVISRLKRGDNNFFLTTDEFMKSKKKNWLKKAAYILTISFC